MARYSCIHFFDYIWISYNFTKLKIAERRLMKPERNRNPGTPAEPWNLLELQRWVNVILWDIR